MRISNPLSSGVDARAGRWADEADHWHNRYLEAEADLSRAVAAIREIEVEACGDSEWTNERLHQALEAVWVRAARALADLKATSIPASALETEVAPAVRGDEDG